MKEYAAGVTARPENGWGNISTVCNDDKPLRTHGVEKVWIGVD
jgi:hypothetical protein